MLTKTKPLYYGLTLMPIEEQTQRELIRIEKFAIDSHTKSNSLSHEVLNRLATIGNDTHSIKQGQSKDKLLTYGIIFVAGILIGTQYRTWLPYADRIVETYKEAKEIRKKNDDF